MRVHGMGYAVYDPIFGAPTPAPPAAAAPLPPAGALDPSQANTLDVSTTDPSAETRARDIAFFNSLPSNPGDNQSPPAPTDYSFLYWIAAAVAGVWLFGEYLGGGRR